MSPLFLITIFCLGIGVEVWSLPRGSPYSLQAAVDTLHRQEAQLALGNNGEPDQGDDDSYWMEEDLNYYRPNRQRFNKLLAAYLRRDDEIDPENDVYDLSEFQTRKRSYFRERDEKSHPTVFREREGPKSNRRDLSNDFLSEMDKQTKLEEEERYLEKLRHLWELYQQQENDIAQELFENEEDASDLEEKKRMIPQLMNMNYENIDERKRQMPLLPWLPATKRKRFPIAKRSPKPEMNLGETDEKVAKDLQALFGTAGEESKKKRSSSDEIEKKSLNDKNHEENDKHKMKQKRDSHDPHEEDEDEEEHDEEHEDESEHDHYHDDEDDEDEEEGEEKKKKKRSIKKKSIGEATEEVEDKKKRTVKKREDNEGETQDEEDKKKKRSIKKREDNKEVEDKKKKRSIKKREDKEEEDEDDKKKKRSVMTPRGDSEEESDDEEDEEENKKITMKNKQNSEEEDDDGKGEDNDMEVKKKKKKRSNLEILKEDQILPGDIGDIKQKKSIQWNKYFGIDRKKKDGREYPLNFYKNLEDERRINDLNEEKIDNMDQKLKTIEDMILSETVKSDQEGDVEPEDIQQMKDKVVSRIATAYSLEKMRNTLGKLKDTFQENEKIQTEDEEEVKKREAAKKKRVAVKKEKAEFDNNDHGMEAHEKVLPPEVVDNDFEEKEDETKKKKKRLVKRLREIFGEEEEENQEDNDEKKKKKRSMKRKRTVKRFQEENFGNNQEYQQLNEAIEDSTECPLLDTLEKRCRGVDILSGDIYQDLLPACGAHQLCYLCGTSSAMCDLQYLTESEAICENNPNCQTVSRSALMMLQGFPAAGLGPKECAKNPCLYRAMIEMGVTGF